MTPPRNNHGTVDLSKFDGSSLNRGRSKPVEVLWWIFRLIFIQSMLPWPNSLKRAILIGFGASVGRRLYIRPGVAIHFPWKLTVGHNVWIGERSTILNLEPVEIESNTAIAHEVYITSGGHNVRSRTFRYANAPVMICTGAWLASRSFVGPGVRVGAGAIVAAGAIVVKDVEDYAIVGGAPARTIGRREISED